jgi:phosphatidylcholine synthase
MWPAALVHVFTAMGVVCALMATLAAISGAWTAVFAWLGVALVIDGLDGTFARLAKVKHHLPRFSGEQLDLVIDYLTYVFVPVIALLQAGYLSGGVGLILASLALLSSLFHFSDTSSKADDHSFVGFPAIWNAVAFYVFAFDAAFAVTAVLVLVCVVLTFIPLKWAHPLRTAAWRPLTLAVMGIWGLAAASVLLSGFPAGFWEKGALLLAGLYGVALTLWSGRAT